MSLSHRPCFIATEEEYKKSLGEVERLVALDPELDTVDGIRLAWLADQVDMYERKRYFVEEQKHLKAVEITKILSDSLMLLSNKPGFKGHVTRRIKEAL